ncbi:MAG: hypothetical protein MMC23_006167 [Stictis urceolatum]|nr:hypothetical protein [Stictis urceolata]
MGFLKSLRGDHSDRIGAGESSSRATGSMQQDVHRGYLPPQGPPPPSSSSRQDGHTPPAGPPPSYKAPMYAPPPGPPPSQAAVLGSEPPPYHDWTSIPDTALLPPPPSLANKFSPTGNAEESEAIRAHQWCSRYPLIQPHAPTEAQIAAVKQGLISLQKPREYTGKLSEISAGVYRCSTKVGSKEACLLSSLPLYFALADSPFRTELAKVVYFEAKIIALGRSLGGEESSLALGFCAVPYPTWRMPGWERGSLAVHSDDGRRYVNDTDGGIDFTTPFQTGETIGLGILFSVPEPSPGFAPSPGQGVPLKGEAFLTRNGRKEGSWNLQEEQDSESEFGVLGVDGRYDLFAAVGTFGEASFDVKLNGRDWLWQPK